jgi:hypothetical protein
MRRQDNYLLRRKRWSFDEKDRMIIWWEGVDDLSFDENERMIIWWEERILIDEKEWMTRRG